MGLGVLGLGLLPQAPALSHELKKIIPLFRFCKIKRFDQIIEFEVNSKRLREIPSRRSACEELRAVLKDLEPLPAAFGVLREESTLGENRHPFL